MKILVPSYFATIGLVESFAAPGKRQLWHRLAALAEPQKLPTPSIA